MSKRPFKMASFFRKSRVFQAIFLGVALFAVAACSSDNDDERFVAGEVGFLYNEGKIALDRNQYERAAVFFDEVERQHPYSEWARRAQLMAAYSYYMANNYEEAILAAERFLTLHPANPSAPYAHYIIAISYYEQITDVGRDQSVTEQALNALRNVTTRYPNTPYAEDAQLKIDLARDHLAGKEMEVGRFYQKQGNLLAAMLRFKTVIEEYQTTTHAPEALHRLVEVYLAMGVEKEAEQIGAVLGFNFPNSRWYEYTYDLLAQSGLNPEAEPRDKKFLGIF